MPVLIDPPRQLGTSSRRRRVRTVRPPLPGRLDSTRRRTPCGDLARAGGLTRERVSIDPASADCAADRAP